MNGIDETDFAFRGYMHDVIILLGGKKEIAELLLKPKAATSDIEKTIPYICELLTVTKKKLVDTNFGNRIIRPPITFKDEPHDTIPISAETKELMKQMIENSKP